MVRPSQKQVDSIATRETGDFTINGGDDLHEYGLFTRSAAVYSKEPAKLEFPEYILKYGKVPVLGDDPPPWAYRGWLLHYVQLVEMQLNGENSRWAYMLELHETGKMPERPIPRIHFEAPNQQVYRKLEEWATFVGYDQGHWRDFSDFLSWLMWGLALSCEKPKLYSDDADERLYKNVDLGLMVQSPYDYFGGWISERKGSGKWNPSGFYPTPHEVCELMTAMLYCDAERDGVDMRSQTVNEPCLGTGRMLLMPVITVSGFSARTSTRS